MCLLDVDYNIPKRSACITIDSTLQLIVSINETIISPTHHSDLVSGSLKQLSQLINLAARVDAWITDTTSCPLSVTVDMATNALKVGLKNLVGDDCSEYQQLTFIAEQLVTSEFARHYTPQMIVMAYMVHSTSSSALYNVLLQSAFYACHQSEEIK